MGGEYDASGLSELLGDGSIMINKWGTIHTVKVFNSIYTVHIVANIRQLSNIIL